MDTLRVYPGQPYPLGATWDGLGVNFALFSEHATRVELCLFDSRHAVQETHRLELREKTDHVWHCYLPDVRPAQLYGYRVYGPYAPEQGQRFNPNKILVDPYAKAIAREGRCYDLQDFNSDNARYAPLCAVIDTAFTWGDDRRPKTPWHKTIIYEAHVKGLSQLQPYIPEALRGSYAGLASEPVIEHLKSLGVTAIELLPIHQCIDEKHLADKGLRNYWGYNTLSYFAPSIRYTSYKGVLSAVREFKMMVRALHAAGIEVILDVVYNHTAEGNHHGPTLSFRGIDNLAYYRLDAKDKTLYQDFTGCGNTLNMQHPRVLQLIMDSLRYWIEDMHVDGFRFDLASALARELHAVDKLGSFFDIIHQDPVISQAKLIAEPWDIAEDGYQVGNFPVLWTEWNGQYRDTVRRFWRGERNVLGAFATRISGSSDLYQPGGRSPHASINFITCHDGFTLNDLVSYTQKHNHANGENNRDGTDDNLSQNFGVEGPTDDVSLLRLRQRQQRNFLATLMFSVGVPMILAGDELAHTQHGTNNAYCQDNETSWLSWQHEAWQKAQKQFLATLIALRKRQPVLQRRRFFTGGFPEANNAQTSDITWLHPDGHSMTPEDWEAHRWSADAKTGALGVLMEGAALDEFDTKGRPIQGDTLLVLYNANALSSIPGETNHLSFLLPYHRNNQPWELLADTSETIPPSLWYGGDIFHLPHLSVVAFRLSGH